MSDKNTRVCVCVCVHTISIAVEFDEIDEIADLGRNLLDLVVAYVELAQLC